MGEITLGQLQVKCRFELITVFNCSIHAKYGEHTRVSLTASVQAEDAEKELLNSEQEQIDISCRKESNTVSGKGEDTVGAVYEHLFTGLIEEAELHKEGGETTLYLKAVSYSWKLDIERKSRSFQDVSRSYKETVDSVLREYGEAAGWDITDQKLSFPLIQYRETDFDFIKRILSHLQVSVTVGDWFPKMKIRAGLTDSKDKGNIDLSRHRYTMIPFQPDRESKQTGEWQQGYELEDSDFYQIGDMLQIQKRYFWVREFQTRSVNHVLRNVCRVFPRECFQVKKVTAETMQGAVITGTVLESGMEKVKFHLDIDREQMPAAAYEFPWEPITGNLLYCMPEKGTRAALHFGKEGESAAGAYSIRENGEDCTETADYNKRYFTTDNGKRMYWNPEEMGLVNIADRNAEIALKDHSLLQVKSNNRISVLAEGQIELRGKNITITAPKETTLVRKDIMSPTVINLCNAFDAIGKMGSFSASPKLVKKKRRKKTSGQEMEKYSLDGVVGAVFANIPSYTVESPICAAIEGSMPFINET